MLPLVVLRAPEHNAVAFPSASALLSKTTGWPERSIATKTVVLPRGNVSKDADEENILKIITYITLMSI